jgi:GTPase SAR1 family protein
MNSTLLIEKCIENTEKRLAECEIKGGHIDQDTLFRIVKESNKLYIALSLNNHILVEFRNKLEEAEIFEFSSRSSAIFFVRKANQKTGKYLLEFLSVPVKKLDIKAISFSDDFMQKGNRNTIASLTEDFIISAAGKNYMVLAERQLLIGTDNEALSFSFAGAEEDKLLGLHCTIRRDDKDSPYIIAVQRNELRNRDKYIFSLLEVGVTPFTIERENIREKTVAQIKGKKSTFLNIWREYCMEQYKKIVNACIEGGFCEIERFDGESFIIKDSGKYTYNNLIAALSKAGLSDCYALFVNKEKEKEKELSDLRQCIQNMGELSEDAIIEFRKNIDAMHGKMNIPIDIEKSKQSGKIVIDSKNGEIGSRLDSAKYIIISGRKNIRNLNLQEDNFESIMNGKNPMPQLSEILLGIDSENEITYRGKKRKCTHLQEIINYFPSKLKPTLNQINALQIALETPDIAVILGPPGTGKSALIKALIKGIEQYEKPQNGTLLTTYQHDALDSLISQAKVNGMPCIRYGGKNIDNAKILSVDLAMDIHEKAEQLEAKYPEYKNYGILYRLRNSIAALDHMQLSFGNVVIFILDILEYTKDVIPVTSKREIEKLKDEYAARLDTYGDNIIAADIAKLRDNKTAYDDDGKITINIAEIKMLRASETAQTFFEKYKDAAAKGDFENAKKNRLRLIAGLTAQRTPCITQKEKTGLRDVLITAISGIESRLQAQGNFEAEIISDYINTYKNNYGEVLYAIKKYNKYVGVTHYQLDNNRIANYLQTDEFENVIIDEAARSSPMDLFVVMSRASKRIILVGDHHQLPQFQDKETYKTAVAEAKKKNAEQPLSSAAENDDNTDCSLFEKLVEVVKKMETTDGITRFAMLKEQYRSPGILGTFVSDRFYKKLLTNGRKSADAFEHKILKYRGKCAVFKEIPLSQGRDQINGDRHKNIPSKSRYRTSEAVWIANDIKQILQGGNSKLSIGIMSFYAGQCEEIRVELSDKGIMVKTEDGDYQMTQEYNLKGNSIYIGTVDSYQGKEFDVVYLSITVANDKGNIGFLSSPNRRCVALSREKKLLIVAGAPEIAAKIDDIREYYDLCKNSSEGTVLK